MMNNFEDLEKKYPKLCRHLQSNFECNTGWYDLIEEACEKLSEFEMDDLYFLQIKEKFGGLRIYISVYDYDLSKIVGDIERRSFKVCEICGQPGIIRPYPYLLTLCDICHEEHEKNVISSNSL